MTSAHIDENASQATASENAPQTHRVNSLKVVAGLLAISFFFALYGTGIIAPSLSKILPISELGVGTITVAIVIASYWAAFLVAIGTVAAAILLRR